MRRATGYPVNLHPKTGFLSTLSLRRATISSGSAETTKTYFYPRSPCGERPLIVNEARSILEFLSTLSLRRATSDRQRGPQHFGISIHALLAESDGGLYSHGLCDILFLSTLSLRRATASFNAAQPAAQNFYPRSPCGERLWCNYTLQNSRSISIHALLAESDIQWEGMRSLSEVFLSTLSLRRATFNTRWPYTNFHISIHALLAESDRKRFDAQIHIFTFLSTLSLRRATRCITIYTRH